MEENELLVSELDSVCRRESIDVTAYSLDPGLFGDKSVGAAEKFFRPAKFLESNTDVMEWNLEVERLLPHLKTGRSADNKVKFTGLRNWKNVDFGRKELSCKRKSALLKQCSSSNIQVSIKHIKLILAANECS